MSLGERVPTSSQVCMCMRGDSKVEQEYRMKRGRKVVPELSPT